MSIATTARTRDLATFVEEFRPGMEHELDDGRSLALWAAGNTDPEARLGILRCLLDLRAHVDGRGDDGVGIFHVLFGVTKRDVIAETVPVVAGLLAAGADPNHLDDREREALFATAQRGARGGRRLHTARVGETAALPGKPGAADGGDVTREAGDGELRSTRVFG